MEQRRSFDTYEAVVEVADPVTPRNKHLRFRLPAGKTIQFHSGQFVQVFVPDGEKPRRTSYSIASAPQMHDAVELCVTLVDGGKSSTYLHSLQVGQKVTIMGPLGKFTVPTPTPDHMVFICTGSGIAPFRSMIHDALSAGHKGTLTLLFGNRFEADIIYRKDWEALAARHANFRHQFVLSREEKPGNWVKGYVQDAIAAAVPDLAGRHFFICGLTNMINAVNDKLASLGVTPDRIHFERYD